MPHPITMSYNDYYNHIRTKITGPTEKAPNPVMARIMVAALPIFAAKEVFHQTIAIAVRLPLVVVHTFLIYPTFLAPMNSPASNILIKALVELPSILDLIKRIAKTAFIVGITIIITPACFIRPSGLNEIGKLDFSSKTENKFPKTATKENPGFAGICGMESLKAELNDQIESILDKDAAASYNLSPPSGILLYGAPGNGKTFFAHKFAEELGIRFARPVHMKQISSSSVGSKWLHETAANLRTAFEEVEAKAKKNRSYGVIIIDEIDTFIPKSSSLGSTPQDAARNEERGEFLTLLENAHERGIYVIATTNFPERLDEALIRPGRFDTKVEVKNPDQPMIEQFMRSMLTGVPHSNGINYRGYSLALARGHATVAEVKLIMECAKRLALRASRNSPELVPVDNAMVRHAVTEHIKRKFPQV